MRTPQINTPTTNAANDGNASALGAPAFSPLYQQIKAQILQGLENAEWQPGEVIPSEFDLAARFGVSQGTGSCALSQTSAPYRPKGQRNVTLCFVAVSGLLQK